MMMFARQVVQRQPWKRIISCGPSSSITKSFQHYSRSPAAAAAAATATATTTFVEQRWYSATAAAAMKAPTLNDKFPNLQGQTNTTDTFDLYDYFGDSWGIVFMHPADFTPVCTTELGRAAALEKEFTKRNIKLCGFSCSDLSAHHDWIIDIKDVTGETVTFPLFCDPDRTKSIELGILDENNKDPSTGLPLTVRSVYVIKPDKTIALMMTYPASTGRNFDEILRVVDSLQLTAKHSVATPVDWTHGDDVIVNFPLTDEMANEKFGKDGYTIIDVPSERGKDNLPKHYLRYTKDPSTA